MEESPEFIRTLVRGIPGIVWLKDADGVFLACNDGAEKFLGVPEAQIAGKSDGDFFPATEAGVYRERDREAIATGNPVTHIEWVALPDGGRPAYLETVRTALFDTEGGLVRVLGVARDLTAAHEERMALRARLDLQEHLEKIPGTLLGAICSFRLRPDGSTCVPYASAALKDVLGFPPEELAEDASAAWSITHPDDRARVRCSVEESARSLSLWHEEFRVQHPAKGEVWLEGRSIPTREADGGTLWHGVFTDVTARKRTEDAVRENQEKASRAFQEAPAPMSIIDLESGRYIEVNAKLAEISGFSRSEIIGKTSMELGVLTPETRQWLASVLHAEGCVSDAEITFRRKNGELIDTIYNGHVITVNGRKQLFSVIQDITERRRVEEDLRSAHSELAAIHSHAPLVLMVVDEDLRVRKVNDMAMKFAARPDSLMLGLRPGGAIGCLNSLADPRGCGHGPSCGACPIRGAVLDTLTNGTRHENVEAWMTFENDPFEKRCLLVFTAPMQFNGARRALLCALDITGPKKAEGSLRESEARFRMLTEGAPIAISTSREGLVVYANPSYVRMFGFDRSEDLLGIPTAELFAPHCRAEVIERVRTTPTPRQYEATGLRRDGSEFPMLVAVISMQFAEGPATVAFITDLTGPKRSEAERFRLEQQLQQVQKLESVGRLAGGIAHDFNNLLTVINGFGDLLLREFVEGDPLREPVAEIRAAGERATDLTKQLLTFSRKQVVAPTVVDLNRLIDKNRNLFQRLLGEDVELVTELDPALGQVMADPGQLHQVLMNLTANARDALQSGGTLTIQTANVELEESYSTGHPEIAPGPFVLLRVSDTGPGIPREIQEHVFEPFFTTKGAGEGTGLGLATTHGIVRQSGGSISLHSEPGRGATFDIYLPRLARQAGPAESDAAPVGSERGTETILVVEDQAEVRKLTVTVLKQCGYRVLEAGLGDEALVAARSDPEPIHLLLTDVVMPGVSGKELAERMMPLHPEMKVLYMSGYPEAVIAQQGVLDAGVEYLNKPFTPEGLARKVRSVLGEARPAAKVLVVDDDPSVRGLFTTILKGGGYDVTVACDGEEAQKILPSRSFDLVITDLVMPNREGIETIRAIRKSHPGVRIIAVSGAYGGSFLGIAAMLGAEATLVKPVSPEQLLQTVRKTLG